MSNITTLKKAGIVKLASKMSAADKRAIESLSHEEVEALISSKAKLGDDFIRKHAKPSAAYAF
jgi:hypothetical protein